MKTKSYEEIREDVLSSKGPQDWVNAIYDMSENFDIYSNNINLSSASVTILLELIFNKAKLSNYKFDPSIIVTMLNKFTHQLRLEYIEMLCSQLMDRFPKGGRPVDDLIVVLKSMENHPETKNSKDSDNFVKLRDLIGTLKNEEIIDLFKSAMDKDLQISLWQTLNKRNLTDHDWDLILEDDYNVIETCIILDIVKLKKKEQSPRILIQLIVLLSLSFDEEYEDTVTDHIVKLSKRILVESEDLSILLENYLTITDFNDNYGKLKESFIQKISFLEPDTDTLKKMYEAGLFYEYKKFNDSLNSEYGLTIEEAFNSFNINFDKNTEEDIDEYKDDILCKLYISYRALNDPNIINRENLDDMLGNIGLTFSPE